MSYLDELNKPQRQAVTHSEGPVMIIAGAGSGKTRVLTYRIAHLIQQNVSPFNILALTFTNKAAREMQERIKKIAPHLPIQNLWMGTFHSIFARLLRYDADKIGYSSNFSIYDTEDSKNLIKSILKEWELGDRYKPNNIFSRISRAKNKLITAQKYRFDERLTEDDRRLGLGKVAAIYEAYTNACLKANAMDFDDLLLNTNLLLENHLDVLAKYQHKFQHILVDEFQDTNSAQYNILHKIAALNENICVVGDDAQSIYAFRGADITNILNFKRDYPDTEIIKLEQNYRSTKNIVGAANELIRHNLNQIPKEVWTDNPTGASIGLFKATTDQEEARLVVNSIFELKMSHRRQNSDFAIIYRTNAQSRNFEEALRGLNLPYQIIGGISFYKRKEVKDALAYMKFALNKQDLEALKRIINFPRRGIGAITFNKIIVAAEEQGVAVWDIIQHSENYLPKRINQTLTDFADLIKSFNIYIETQDAFTATKNILKDSGLLSEYYNEGTSEGLERHKNLEELLNAVRVFTLRPDEDHSLVTFLQEAALLTSADEEDENDVITLMTIHMAKGLEFEYVYVVGLEQNLFPAQMMLGGIEDLEEERRLFYVAITRAKQQLFLAYALRRFRFGDVNYNQPSQFLDDIPVKYLTSSKTPSKPQIPTHTGSKLVRLPKHAKFAPLKAETSTDLELNQTVYHKKFGKGQIQKLYTVNGQARAVIKFEYYGQKTMMLAFARLSVSPF